MGMTIKKAKAIVKGITDKIDCNTIDIDDWAEFWGFTREEYEEFLDMSIKAISIMHKYQKIEEIVSKWQNETDPKIKFASNNIERIKEVLDNEKIN